MAVNYASKFSAKVDERFTLNSMTAALINQDYDWVGVQTVNVYSIPTSPMNDYVVSGSNRYGTPNELENEVQELTVSQDRSFTFTIDRMSRDDTLMTMEAGAALGRQVNEVIIPEVDTYRLKVICENAGASESGATSGDTAYEIFLTLQEDLDENKAPRGGRIAVCNSAYYKYIKLDPSFTKLGDLATTIAIRGQVGEIDGVPLITVPSFYLPEGNDLVLTNKLAVPAPTKLIDYTIHDNPPGISGWLVEGRIRYDAFVLNNKKAAIAVHTNTGSEEAQG